MMKPSFTTAPQIKHMVTELDARTHPEFDKWTNNTSCSGILILCVECGWTGHFCDGSTDHFFNHKCKMRTESISTTSV